MSEDSRPRWVDLFGIDPEMESEATKAKRESDARAEAAYAKGYAKGRDDESRDLAWWLANRRKVGWATP